MNTVIAHVNTSPVNMEDRKSLGIKAGDTVKIHQKIQDKGKTRIQIFDGVVLARKHGDEPGATFTVRKVASGVGVEKIFPLYSPLIDKIEIVKRAKVRRAKLYYIREKVARQIKRQMRRMSLVQMGTESETEAAARIEAEEAAAAEAKAAAEAAEAEKQAVAEAESAKEAAAKEETAAEEDAPAEAETTPETEDKTEVAAEVEKTEEPAEAEKPVAEEGEASKKEDSEAKK
jgi:large subunit ribosomal protein L19